MPHDMRDASIAMLYKNKEIRSDCNKYCSISKPKRIGKLADLTKAFALVNRDGLFKILVKIACPLTLIIASTSPFMMTRRKLVFAGSISEVLDI